MTIKRIVPNLMMNNKEVARYFYRELLGVDPAMDLGWVMTFQVDETTKPQLSLVSKVEEGASQPVVSIEVDDVDLTHAKALSIGARIAYGPVDEKWGVRRFHVYDPSGNLLNILQHV